MRPGRRIVLALVLLAVSLGAGLALRLARPVPSSDVTPRRAIETVPAPPPSPPPTPLAVVAPATPTATVPETTTAPALADPAVAGARASEREAQWSLFAPGRVPHSGAWPAATTSEVAVGPGRGTIPGLVVDGVSEAPVAGATVRLCGVVGYDATLLPGPVAAALTDELGRFTFTGVPAKDDVLIEAAAPAPAGVLSGVIRRGVEQGPYLSVLRLNPPRGEVEARAVDTAGAPIAGAQLWASRTFPSRDQGIADEGSLEKPLTPSASGWARASFPPGPVLVRAAAPGFAAGKARAFVSSGGSTRVEVPLRAPASIRARVADGTGRAVEDATVEVVDHDGSMYFGREQPDGAFVTTLPAGRFAVVAMAEGFANARCDVDAPEGATVEASLVLEPERDAVEGRVIDALGLPLSGASVVALDPMNDARVLSRTMTETDGRFRLERMRGKGEARIRLPEWPGADLNVLVKAGRRAREVVIRAGPPLRLTLRLPSEPPSTPHWGLHALAEDGTLDWLEVSPTSEEGREVRFELDRVPAGAIVVERYPLPPLTLPPIHPESLESEIVVAIDPPLPSVLRGRVVDAAGRPVTAAAVVARLPGPFAEAQRADWSWSALADTMTDAQGRFALGGLPPDIAVFVSAEGVPEQRFDLTGLPAGEARQEVLRVR